MYRPAYQLLKAIYTDAKGWARLEMLLFYTFSACVETVPSLKRNTHQSIKTVYKRNNFV